MRVTFHIHHVHFDCFFEMGVCTHFFISNFQNIIFRVFIDVAVNMKTRCFGRPHALSKDNNENCISLTVLFLSSLATFVNLDKLLL